VLGDAHRDRPIPDRPVQRLEVVAHDLVQRRCSGIDQTDLSELSEDTLDFFAQDQAGNVWYFGEESKSYVDDALVSLEGSWQAGRDDAKPGIVMEAHPKVKDFYRQEYAIGVAEDLAEVKALNQTVHVPAGTFSHVLETEETTPIEPDALEQKFYAPRVGLIKKVDVDTGGGTKLIAYTIPDSRNPVGDSKRGAVGRSRCIAGDRLPRQPGPAHLGDGGRRLAEHSPARVVGDDGDVQLGATRDARVRQVDARALVVVDVRLERTHERSSRHEDAMACVVLDDHPAPERES
jgi:hypothetical protein